MYIQFLKNSFASEVSVKNYISGARTWVLQHNGNVFAFDSIEVRQMFSALVSTSRHIPSPAFPLNPSHVKTVCDYIDSHPNIPLAVKPCLLIGYSCFLRTCNLLSPSTNNWIGPHTLLVSDVIPSDQGLLIYVRSLKNFNVKNPKFVQVNRVDNVNYCPVAAWSLYVTRVNPCPIGPAFMVDDYTPLVSRNVVDVMNLALKPVIPSGTKVRMHSLRRGGTQSAAEQGASNEHLMLHGAWSSRKGLKYYLPQKNNNFPNIIAKSLA